jgi:hypothetical protein
MGNPVGIAVIRVTTREQKHTFIDLPYSLHEKHPLWVPPIRMFEKHYIDPSRNHHLEYSDIALYLALLDGKPVGRIMGIVNRKLNQKWSVKEARFCNFESINDQGVSSRLLGAVESWARELDMDHVTGPLGFSNQDPQGFLIEGFEHRPSVNTVYNFEYVPGLIEGAGYRKKIDYLTYRIPIPEKVSPVIEKIAERIAQRGKLNLLEFEKTREAKRYLPVILRFMNEIYTNIYGFIPLSEKNIQKSVRTFTTILEPRFVKILTAEEDVVAFFFGIRDVTEGFRRANGRLFPFGFFQIKNAQKKAKRLDLLLGGIREDYRGKGLDTLLGIAMVRSARSLHMEHGDSHNIAETNKKMCAEMEKIGSTLYKRHRVYRKNV